MNTEHLTVGRHLINTSWPNNLGSLLDSASIQIDHGCWWCCCHEKDGLEIGLWFSAAAHTLRVCMCARPWGVCVKQNPVLLFPGWFMLWRLPLRSLSHYWKGGWTMCVVHVSVCLFVNQYAVMVVFQNKRQATADSHSFFFLFYFLHFLSLSHIQCIWIL